VKPFAPALRAALPSYGPGQKIGLLGGSFNPPHQGHRLISLMALRRLRLDWVWWLVTPGNPLKDNSTLPPIDIRISACRAVSRHPRIAVTGIEARLGTRYTAESLARLRMIAPDARFVWLMGADNLAGFHRWQNWLWIATALPVAVMDRPSATLQANNSRAAHALRKFRLPEHHGPALAGHAAPAWLFLHGPRSQVSSTDLRREGIRI
jgi:nicotinate-nucleotide adenylyltransferase